MVLLINNNEEGNKAFDGCLETGRKYVMALFYKAIIMNEFTELPVKFSFPAINSLVSARTTSKVCGRSITAPTKKPFNKI